MFAAIALANPGGLGESRRHDVRRPPRVTLLTAMAEARRRDRIADQYAGAYQDVFGSGCRGWPQPGHIGVPAVRRSVRPSLGFCLHFPTAMSGGNSALAPPGSSGIAPRSWISGSCARAYRRRCRRIS